MAATRAHRKLTDTPATADAAGVSLKSTAPAALSAADEAVDVPSPAKALQEALSAALSEPQPAGKWSPRATLLFIVTVCGGFWLAVGWTVWLQLRR